jgi:hypothetical protein
MTAHRTQEIACQQVLAEDSSVFSIQWSVFPHSLAACLSPEILLKRYLEYIRSCTASVIRPTITAEGLEFRLFSFRTSLISFLPPVRDDFSRCSILRICGGVLVQPRQCRRGELRFITEDTADGIKVSLQLSDFFPIILGGPAPCFVRRWLYRRTQAFIHRLVTIRFLILLYRELAGVAAPVRLISAHVRDGRPV